MTSVYFVRLLCVSPEGRMPAAPEWTIWQRNPPRARAKMVDRGYATRRAARLMAENLNMLARAQAAEQKARAR